MSEPASSASRPYRTSCTVPMESFLSHLSPYGDAYNSLCYPNIMMKQTQPLSERRSEGTAALAGVHPLLQQLQRNDRVVEMSNGRHFVFRPLEGNDGKSTHLDSLIDGNSSFRTRKNFMGSDIRRAGLRDNNSGGSKWTPDSNSMDRRFRDGESNSPFATSKPRFLSEGIASSYPAHGVSSHDSPIVSESPLMKLLNEKQTYTRQNFGKDSISNDNVMTKFMRSSRSSPSVRKQGSGNGVQWIFDIARAAEANLKMNERLNSDNSRVPASVGSFSPPSWRSSKASSTKDDSGSLGRFHGNQSSSPKSPSRIHEWDFNNEEDIVDEEYLYRRDEAERRKNPRYLAQTKQLHDLHIVMPLSIANGKIVVEDPQGANYYEFSDEKSLGAHILFGKGVATPELPTASLSSMGPPIDSTTSGVSLGNESVKSELDGSPPELAAGVSRTITSPHSSQTTTPVANVKRPVPACDVWASFLHVRLGTIYNLSHEQIIATVEKFNNSFDIDLCKFYVPISVDCRGIYPSTDELISQRAVRPSLMIRDAKDGKKSANERYETRGSPSSENDVKRLRMLKRYIKRFAKSLIEDLGFNSSIRPNLLGEVGLGLDQQPPKPCIELHDNCKNSTITNGGLKIVIREWSKLNDPDIFKKVWNGQLSSNVLQHGVAEEVWTKLLEQKSIPSCRVVFGELRLEHNHLRMVDPRWENELVLGRRIADSCPQSESPDPYEYPARLIFCSRVPKPQVSYLYAKKGEDPREAALSSRLGELFRVHLVKHPYAGVSQLARNSLPNQEDLTVTTDVSDSAIKNSEFTYPTREYGRMEPVPTKQMSENSAKHEETVPPFLQKIMKDINDAASALQDMSALKDFNASDTPVSTTPCKFFVKGGCARANSCYFLHPVDLSLESKLDIRRVVPKHPKFY